MLRRYLLLLTCAAAPAFAQDAPVAEVVVTGRGLADRPGEKAASVTVVTREDIAANASGRLESVLLDAAGVQQFRRSDSRSANPTSQGLSLRGIGGNAASRALLILDGVPQADPFGGWVAFPAYATGRIGRVRITRGGGSGYWGAGALSGTIELESAGPGQLAPAEFDLAYGSRAAIDASGSATLARAGGFATLSAAYARGDGFVPTVAADRGPADRAAPYRQWSGAARGVIAVAADTELQANLTAFDDRRERGTAFTANRSQGADASVRLIGRGRWGWSLLGYVQTRAFASEFASVTAGRTSATQTLDQYNTPATGVGGRVELSPPVGHSVELRLGADLREVSGRTQELFTFVSGVPTRQRIAGGSSRTAGLFADISRERGPLTLALGGRVDRWRIADGSLVERALASGAPLTDSRFADRSGTQATGRAGVAYALSPALLVRAAAYRGWRLPTLNELYRPFRVGADATGANAALAPERLGGVEVGLSLTPGGGVTMGLTGYRNRLTSAIANVTVAGGPGTFPGVGFVGASGSYRVRQNLDAIRAQGFELDAQWRRGPWQLRASWTHSVNRVRASGAAAALDGLRPAQTPRDVASATLGWARDGWRAQAVVRPAARQFEDDQNIRSLAATTTIDAALAAPLGRSLTLDLRAENLTDARVEAGVSATGTVERASPRTLWFGLKWRVP